VGTKNQQPKAASLVSDPLAAKWDDGTARSLGNCFTRCLDGRHHGFVIGAPVAPSAASRKRGPKPRIEYGAEGGPALGSEQSTIPRMRTTARKHTEPQEA
jgi:hypothetical protein